MCGIVCLHGPQQAHWIDEAARLQFHRGPDATGIYRDSSAQISMAAGRLAIIDREHANQPMRSADGRYTLVYNGEIYNAPALRGELEGAGVRFATDHSDTEVLLVLLMREGLSCLGRLNGMFAFAFFDSAEKVIHCARDRFGIKPFYYTTQQGRFLCASELKTICSFPFVQRELNRQSLSHYLSLQYVPGEETILEGVKRLGPGHSLTYRMDSGEVQVSRWWDVSFEPNATTGNWPERIRESLDAAVLRWSLSDVPVAVALSGGLDSSAIVGSLAKAGRQVSTFSLGFEGEGEAEWNEIPLARLVAKKWGTEHQEIVLDPVALIEDLPQMVWALDEPYGGGLPSWSVFKSMSQSFKVALTGTGGDELFGNYGKWRGLERGFFARLLAGERSASADTFEKEFFNRFYYFSEADKRDVLAGSAGLPDRTSDYLFRIFNAAPSQHVRDQVAYTDINTQLPEEFLMMTDRFSMAHSVEARTPFLDHEFAQLVFSIPAGERTSRGSLKGLLREAVAPLLPTELLTARKSGFVIPLQRWIRGPLRSHCQQLLDPERLRKQGLIAPDFAKRYLVPHLDGRADYTNKIWTMIMFQMWHTQYIEREGL